MRGKREGEKWMMWMVRWVCREGKGGWGGWL
jgi:hypothetical protein